MKYQRYPNYKDSGIEWLGEIPEHWMLKPVKRVATYNDDVLGESTPEDYELQYVDISSVDAVRGVTNSENMLFRNAPSRARRKVRDGDIIVSTVRTYLRAIAGIKDPDENLIVSTGFAVIRPRSELSPSFANYLFRSEYVISEVISRSVGVSYPAINASELVNISVPIPPPDEQEVIGTFLDRETAEIDSLIAKQEELITRLQEKRQALISHAVTKGLDSTVPMRDSGVDWIGEVPTHWRVQRLKYVARLESGHTPSKSVPEYWENCTIHWISLNDVASLDEQDYICTTVNKISELGMANSSARLLPAGTVVLSRDATVGKSAILGCEMATAQHFVDWVCGPSLLPEYLLMIFRGSMQPEFGRLTMGATVKTIGMPEVKKFRIPVPPIEEQASIVRHIRSIRDKLDEMTNTLVHMAAVLRERRSALITAAVTGQIDVRGKRKTPDEPETP